MKTILYRIGTGLGMVLGLFFLINANMMGLGAVVVTPIGFLFGLGEAGSYTNLVDKLTNLFWHVAPGLAGAGLCLLFLAMAFGVFWGSIVLWQWGLKANT